MHALLLSMLWIAMSVGLQGTDADPPPDVQSDGTATPVAGRVTGDRVYVRSGPSTNYYPVTRLSTGDRVVIHEMTLGWASITPPTGAFSLIAKDFVDPDGEDAGVVNGQRVWVHAGSELSNQRYAKQLKLDRGQAVRVLGTVDEFYKIAPPDGARLWITLDYVEVVDELAAVPAAVPIAETPEPADSQGAAPQGAAPQGAAPQAAPPLPDPQDVEGPDLEEQIKLIEADLQGEFKKDMSQRELDPIIARLQTIAEQQQDLTAQRYARYRIEQLNKATQHIATLKEMEALGNKLQEDRKQFLRDRADIRPQPLEIGREYDARGKLLKSMAYSNPSGPRRYRLVDPESSGTIPATIGYVEIDPQSNINPQDFVGRYVGIRATGRRLLGSSVEPMVVFSASEIVILETSPQKAHGRSGP